MIISKKLGFHISVEGGRVAVWRLRPNVRASFRGPPKRVGYLAEDKKSILGVGRAVVGRLRPGDFLADV